MPKIKRMQTNTTTDKQELYQHILNTMCVTDFNTLPQYLGVSTRMTTMRLKDPTKMDARMIQLLAAKMGCAPKDLIEKFGAGKNALPRIERERLMQEVSK